MVTNSPSVTRLLALLQGVKSSGKGWTALCPGHEDRQNSLSIIQGDDGRVLINCFADCDTRRVVDAMGLTMADLFENSTSNGSVPPGSLNKVVQKTRSTRGKEARFEIRNQHGDLIAVHKRVDYPDRPKKMWWELPDGSKDLGDLKTPAMPLLRFRISAVTGRRLPGGGDRGRNSYRSFAVCWYPSRRDRHRSFVYT